MHFQNPPLIELVAEFRWIPTSEQGEPVTMNAFMLLSPVAEETIERMRLALAKHGYHSVERLIPAGLPIAPYQPVVRFRKTSDESTAFHIGIGLFSAHALPPYKTWDNFRPVIRLGLASLLSARSGHEPKDGFSSVTLRYINAFTKELVGSLTTRQLFEALDLTVNPPAAVLDGAADPNLIDVACRIQTTLKTNQQLTLSAERNPARPDDILLDTTVASLKSLAWETEAAMRELEIAHDYIRQLFLSMVRPIQHLLSPVEEAAS